MFTSGRMLIRPLLDQQYRQDRVGSFWLQREFADLEAVGMAAQNNAAASSA